MNKWLAVFKAIVTYGPQVLELIRGLKDAADEQKREKAEKPSAPAVVVEEK